MKFKRGDLVTINDPELIGCVYQIQKFDDHNSQYAYFTNDSFCHVDNLSLFQKNGINEIKHERFIGKCRKILEMIF